VLVQINAPLQVSPDHLASEGHEGGKAFKAPPALEAISEIWDLSARKAGRACKARGPVSKACLVLRGRRGQRESPSRGKGKPSAEAEKPQL
jgi:hypothetical protein